MNRLTFFKYLVLLLPIIICSVLFIVKPSSIQPSGIMAVYASNFIHYDLDHFLGNILAYLVFAYLSFHLLKKTCKKKKLFWVSFVALFTIVPIAVALAKFEAIGFSGIVSGFVGLYSFSAALFLHSKSERNIFPFFFVFLLGVLIVAIVYSYYVFAILISILVGFAFWLVIKNLRPKSNLLVLVPYLVGIVGYFQA